MSGTGNSGIFAVSQLGQVVKTADPQIGVSSNVVTVADATTAVALSAPYGEVTLTSGEVAANTQGSATMTNTWIRPGSIIECGIKSAHASWAPAGSAPSLTIIPAAAGGTAVVKLGNGGATALGALAVTYWFRVRFPGM